MRQVPAFRFRPPAPTRAVVPRSRLLAELLARFEYRLTTVVAGPGFGKTTLLGEAVRENELAPRGLDVWLSCQPTDEAASSLARALLHALQVDDRNVLNVPSSAGRIATAVLSRAPAPVALVLDDVQHIPVGSPGAVLLQDLLVQLPENGHVVLVGRTAPPVATERLRAQGRLYQLDEMDLAFDAAELQAFAGLRHVSTDLLRDAGSWPALAELVATTGHRSAAGYLWEELLASRDGDECRLLAQMAAVGGADEEVAAAMAGRPVELAEVVRGLPLVSIAPDGWYSLHSLWAPALSAALSADEVAAARMSAAMLLVSRGEVESGVRLLIEAQAWEELLAVIRQVGTHAFPPVAADVLQRWYDQLPQGLRDTPEGLLLRGSVQQAHRPAAAVAALRAAAERFRVAGDADGEIACLNHLTYIFWWQEDPSALTDVVRRAAALAAAGHRSADLLACLARVQAADAAGDEQAALNELDRAPQPSDTEWDVVFDYHRAVQLLASGEPAAASEAAERSMQRSRATRRRGPALLWISGLWLNGHVDQALAVLAEFMQLPQASAQNHVVECGLAALWTAYAGQLDAASEYLQEAQAACASAQGQHREILLAVARAARAVAAGDEALAAEVLREELRQRPLGTPGPGRVVHRATLALFYVLLPECREYWTSRPWGPSQRTALQLAQALSAARDSGDLQPVATLEPPCAGTVRAHLPAPWVAELAVVMAASGREDVRELVEALGSPGRGAVRAVTSSRHTRIAKAARTLLAGIPRAPQHVLEIRALGPLELGRNGAAVAHPELRRERVRQLLLYLVVHRECSREQAAGALWPDLDDADAAARNLRVTLTYLHRVLEPDRGEDEPPYLLRVRGPRLQLCDEGDYLRIDAREFERLIDQGQAADRAGTPSQALAAYQQALALYRGDYLADVPYADWALLARDRLRAQFVEAALRAGELLLATGARSEALILAERVLTHEPYAEPAYRLLAAGYLASGDRASALRALQRCRAMLTELGAAPDPATLMLERQVQTTSRASDSSCA